MSSDRSIPPLRIRMGVMGMGDTHSSSPSQVTMNEEPILLPRLQSLCIIPVRHSPKSNHREREYTELMELHPKVWHTHPCNVLSQVSISAAPSHRHFNILSGKQIQGGIIYDGTNGSIIRSLLLNLSFYKVSSVSVYTQPSTYHGHCLVGW